MYSRSCKTDAKVKAPRPRSDQAADVVRRRRQRASQSAYDTSSGNVSGAEQRRDEHDAGDVVGVALVARGKQIAEHGRRHCALQHEHALRDAGQAEREAHADRDDERDDEPRSAQTERARQVVRLEAADRVAERHQHQRDQQVADRLERGREPDGHSHVPSERRRGPPTAPYSIGVANSVRSIDTRVCNSGTNVNCSSEFVT